MCEANAYLLKDGREELVMEAVDSIEPEDENSWRLVNIFGEQKILQGRIRGMQLVDHKILFQPKSD